MLTSPSALIGEAQDLDKRDPLSSFRDEFCFPETEGQTPLYFAGHSLGLMPKSVPDELMALTSDWKRYGVEGHTKGQRPWLPYHELLSPSFARIVGAEESEVVCMNTLTVNLHLLMTSFYRPTPKRFKIICEANPFPSDRYAFLSQARLHGYSAEDSVLEFPTTSDGLSTDPGEVMEFLKVHKDECAIVILGHSNFLSGEAFNIERVSQFCRENDIALGLNLAHGVGNLKIELSRWDVDFAVWCSYKYLNAGPGSLAGAYVNKRHHNNPKIPRLEGWWGQNKNTRFRMEAKFDPIPTAEAWQLSNPPILSMCAVWASMQIFEKAGFEKILDKSQKLTTYFSTLLRHRLPYIEVVTPENDPKFVRRGSMLCLKISEGQEKLIEKLSDESIYLDFRHPNIIRATPIALYTRFEDVWRLVDRLKSLGLGEERT